MPHQQSFFEDNLYSVTELPDNPVEGGIYYFNKVPRAELTGNNHGLHKYPAKFIPHFPEWALRYLNPSNSINVLDPYCGSGTTLIEAGLKGHHCYGVDISPLAVTIAKAKTARINDDICLKTESDSIVQKAKKHVNIYIAELKENHKKNCLGMHWTWSNWFSEDNLAKLLALKTSIDTMEDCELRNFSLACLSSVTKSASYLNEDQIKVRYQEDKVLKDPFVTFPDFFVKSGFTQQNLSNKFNAKNAEFHILNVSAENTGIKESSIDAIITSPPYINAIDYTMTHKYNLFVLGLIEPDNFKEHCRDYIGVTERAVRSADYKSKPQLSYKNVQAYIDQLWSIDTQTSKNRAYVVFQYFSGMVSSFIEMHNLLKNDGKLFFVIGEVNNICGIEVPTAMLLKEIAIELGFEIELEFFHRITNRSAMRMNRAKTGGSIKNELVYVFKK